jgi:hypothetical protein
MLLLLLSVLYERCIKLVSKRYNQHKENLKSTMDPNCDDLDMPFVAFCVVFRAV